MEWPIWTRLGWQDVKRRYRRTVLGPFWATASLGMFIGGMVFIWAPLFKTSVTGYLPFLAAGVPSVDLIDFDFPAWHTAADTLDAVSARSLQIVGDVLLAALPQIEAKLK